MHGLARIEAAVHRRDANGLADGAADRAPDGAAKRGSPEAKHAGEAGERAAYFYLRRLGYTVVARRWRAPNLNGEIDLIVWDGETLCFVEVKTRTAEDRFAPGYAMNRGKWDALRRMARAYVQGLPALANEPANPVTRFDLISVYLTGGAPRLEHDIGVTGL